MAFLNDLTISFGDLLQTTLGKDKSYNIANDDLHTISENIVLISG
ncbi:hypothetical protein [Clostridium gasigenes]|nr:hypothetical protein [Clostridium gasigenes]